MKEFKLRLYKAIIQIKSDNGKIRTIEIPVVTSKKTAIEMIMKAEHCPEHCINIVEFKQVY